MLSDSGYRALCAIDWKACLPDVVPTITYIKKRERYAMRFYGEFVAVYAAFDNWERDHHVNYVFMHAHIHDDDTVELLVELETEAEKARRLDHAVPVQLALFAA